MKTYNIFVSHAWRYSEHYHKVIEWLEYAEAMNRLSYRNYSVPRHDPLINPDTPMGKARLKEELKGQIRPATIVIALSGMYAAHSEWIDYEIDTAAAMNKYIICLKPWGQERVPTKISNNASNVVGWNSNSLIEAILRL